jgi:hypothetical protein
LSGKEQDDCWSKFLAKYQIKKTCPAPVTAYRQAGAQLAVDVSGFSPKFAAEIEEKTRVKLWTLQVSIPQRFAREPPSPINVLVMSGCEKIFLELRNESQVCAMKCVEDLDDSASALGAGGPAVLVGCDDGNLVLWDVEGRDKGQMYAQMRSLSGFEIILPIAVLVISTLQIISFAFTPRVPWQANVRAPTRAIYHASMLDYDFLWDIPRIDIIYIKIRAVTSMMFLYAFSGMIGLPELLKMGTWWIQGTEFFRKETFVFGPAHIILTVLRSLIKVLKLWIQVMSTVAVVPMMTICAQFLNCKPGFHPGSHLAYTEDVECLTGNHLWFTVVLCPVILAFTFVLIPHALVRGDCDYVPRDTLYDVKVWKSGNMWRQATQRASTTIHMGGLHLHPQKVFENTVGETFAKMALPFISNCTDVRLQMMLMSIVMFFVYQQTVRYPLYIEEKLASLHQHLKGLTFLAMVCAALTVFIDDQESYFSFVLIVAVTISVSVHFLYDISKLRLRRRHVQVFHDFDGITELDNRGVKRKDTFFNEDEDAGPSETLICMCGGNVCGV